VGRSRGRVVRRCATVALALAMLGCTETVPGRGVPPSADRVFDTDSMNRDIAGQYADRFGPRVDVRCPPEQPVVVDRTFTCDIVGQSGKIEVKVTGADGDYVWRPVP